MTVHVPNPGYRPTLPAALARAAAEFGDREFIVTPTHVMTYAEADAASRRVARQLLADSIGKGTHVGLVDTFGTDWVVGLLAISRIGALAMLFPSTYRQYELQRGLRHGDVHALIVPPTILGRDVLETVEGVAPGIAESDETTLFLDDLPFLRHVYVNGRTDRRWARRTSLAITAPDDFSPALVSEPLLQAAEDAVHPSDPMVVVFTSGATSDPKAVIHTHGAQIRHGWNLARNFGSGISPDERVFCALPFFWIGGLTYQLMGALSVGSAVLCIERFEPTAALDLMESQHATRMVGWGSQISAVRDDPSFAGRDLSSMPMFAPRSGAAADPELRHTSLGMTETGGPHTACPPDEAARILPESMRGSFGRAVPGVEHKIVDPDTGAELGDGEVGELCVRGYNVMAGMYKRERREVFDADGWYHTGDRCVFRDGYLFYLGRLTEMIKSAGANVSPREVEVALESVPGVQTAIVVGLPDDERGEIVAAAVIPSPGAALDAPSVIEQVSQLVSGYKAPRVVRVLAHDDVPWLPTGKPDKQSLVGLLREG